MQLGAVTPVLRIFDEEKAREFYEGFLGFSKDWEHRFGANFPVYLQLSRDACVVHLSSHHGDGCPGSAVRINTVGISQLCDSLREKNYRHCKPECIKTEWKTLEMTIKDPFGNTLTFTERL